jgi:hypothetical protein
VGLLTWLGKLLLQVGVEPTLRGDRRVGGPPWPATGPLVAAAATTTPCAPLPGSACRACRSIQQRMNRFWLRNGIPEDEETQQRGGEEGIAAVAKQKSTDAQESIGLCTPDAGERRDERVERKRRMRAAAESCFCRPPAPGSASVM